MILSKHIENTDGKGKEIHKYIDRFAWRFGLDHRVVYHHQRGGELLVKEFGESSRWIIEQHLKDDWVEFGKIPKDFNDEDFFREEWVFDLHLYKKALNFAKSLYKKKG